MALVEWADNITISADASEVYWPAQLGAKHIPAGDLEKQRYWHALPHDGQHMDYQEFLAAWRKLLGLVVKDAYSKLKQREYTPANPRRSGERHRSD